MNIILFILLSTWYLVLSTYPVSAGNNLTFTCTDSACTKSSDLPLFYEQNIYPSYSVSQTTTITNSRSTNCNLNFKLIQQSTTDLLSSALTISSISDSTVWYSGLLKSLFDNNTHTLGSIPTNSSKIINWTTSFNQDAGNEYQNKSNLFDIDFNFACDDPPVCNDTTPATIPQNFSAIPGQNSVTLNWTKPTGNFTYYLIAFGDNQNADKYGNPNIGGPDTTSYIVNGLSSGTTYYFKIRTGNGCAPGNFSNIISATPSGQIITIPVVPAGFQPGVLGTETTNPNIAENPNVLGQQDTNRGYYWYLIYLLIFLILILTCFLLYRHFIY